MWSPHLFLQCSHWIALHQSAIDLACCPALRKGWWDNQEQSILPVSILGPLVSVASQFSKGMRDFQWSPLSVVWKHAIAFQHNVQHVRMNKWFFFINIAPKYYRQSHKDPVVRIKNTLPLHMVKHWVLSIDITNTWIHQQQGVPHFSFTSSLFQTRKKTAIHSVCLHSFMHRVSDQCSLWAHGLHRRWLC